MRYFAKIEENSLVSQVITLSDEIENPSFYLESLGIAGTWIETWIDGGQRKNFAANGSIYNADLDAFIPQKMEDELDFVFNENLCRWVPPIAKPDDGKKYGWDYINKVWVEVTDESQEV